MDFIILVFLEIFYFFVVNVILIFFAVLGLIRIRRGTLSWTPYKIGVGVQLFGSFGHVIQIAEGREAASFDSIGSLVSTAILIVLFYILTKSAIEKDRRL